MSRVIVIGAGLAGLVAAIRLAEHGTKVVLLTKGLGGLQLGQGSIDVLGYDPARVSDPFTAVERLAEQEPAHPYAVIGPAHLRPALAYLKTILGELLVGEPDRNFQLPTAVGAIRPTCLAQPSMVAGDVDPARPLAVVGLQQLKDFHPKLIAQNLARTRLASGDYLTARPLSVNLPARAGEVDSSAVTYARAFDDPAFREQAVKLIAPQLEDGESVGLPAVLGLRDLAACREFAKELGHPVFEIPLPPPSVPGMRLNEALLARAKAIGVRVVNGSRATSVKLGPAGVQSVTVATAGAPREFAGDAFMLATGGFESGALELDSYGRVSETLFDLPLSVPAGRLINGDYWGADQPLFRCGVRVNPKLQVIDEAGDLVHSNLFAVGGILAGAARPSEKSGDGIALASAVRAADSIEELS